MPEPRFVTDGGGRFAFEQLPDGEYELRTDRTELYEKAMAVVRAGLDSAVIVVELGNAPPMPRPATMPNVVGSDSWGDIPADLLL